MKKRFILLITILAVVTSFSEAMGRKEKNDDELFFAASYMTLNNPFFVALHQSIEDDVETHGDRVVALNPDYDQILQITQIEDMISLGIDGLFLNPVDWKGIRPALEAAKKADIPVFVVDAPVYDDKLVVSTIVSDNHEAGKLAGLDLLTRLDNGNIVILDHPTNKPSIDRILGFLEILQTHPEFTVVSRLSAFGTLEGALPQMENALQAHNKIDVVFGSNDPTSLGAIAALVGAKRLSKTLVYSVDGSPEGKEMIKSGLMTGSSAQSPREIGRIAVKLMYKHLGGETVPATQFVPVTLITQDNVDEFPADEWQ